jgi:hypothetical protein
MQGYFVKVKEGIPTTDNQTGTLITPVSARTTSTHAFYKAAQLKNKQMLDLIRLNVTRNGITDETAIRFNTNATTGFDDNYDAFKLFPGDWYETPQIYSFTDNGTRAAINSLPSYFDDLIIPLGFKATITGEYSLSVSDLTLDENTEVWFEDILESKIYELSGLNYTFNSEVGQFDNRFRIIFALAPSTVPNIANENPNVDIFSNGNDIYLKSGTPNAIIGSVHLINILGQTAFQTSNSTEGFARINVKSLPAGTYIVKLTGKYGVFTKKIFLVGQ